MQYDNFDDEDLNLPPSVRPSDGIVSKSSNYYSVSDGMDDKTKQRIRRPFLGLCLIAGACLLAGLLALIIVSIVMIKRAYSNLRFFPNPPYTSSTDYLHFVVVGDYGRGNQAQMNVASGMAKYCANVKKCDFIISTGDNIYDNGVTSAQDEQFKTKFENIYTQESIKNLEWYKVHGNHDYRSNPDAQIEYATTSYRWRMPNFYYNFTKWSSEKGFNVTFVMTDTNPFVTGYFSNSKMNQTALNRQKAFNEAQLNMTETILRESYYNQDNNSWVIVVGHHPVYSAGAHYNTPELLQQYEPLFVKYKLPLYMCGHDHLINWLANGAKGPTQYIVSGGGAGNTKMM